MMAKFKRESCLPERDSSSKDSTNGVGPPIPLSSEDVTPISPWLLIRSGSRHQGGMPSFSPSPPSSEITDNENSWDESNS
ncbi:hypothetical protein L484_004154 [Morus notabilis]|uniref:Uncharacterized protein n=1 Tax=Morus notabilis TaxID=981085 RepID=W9QMA8_9ROSA|nr:hypothetical protein L484_004154 [Morus notabilis]